MEQSVESAFQKLKVIASLPYFAHISDLKKNFSENTVNLVLIASTVQVEFPKFNFNFDDVRTNFFEVLTYYGFSRLIVLE